MTDTGAEDPRRRHYGQFYGLDPLPDGPIAVVWGNCQAEALRILLSGSGRLAGVRVPPVFELNEDDLPHVRRLLARTTALVAQPVRDDYRGLPIGTAQVRSLLPPDASLVVFPAFRYAGLYPWQVIVRQSGVGDPPGAPYHDLRTATIAAGGTADDVRVSDTGIRAVARASIEQLRDREQRSGAVPISDVIEAAGADSCHVINHPGNTVLVELARRVQSALGVPVDAADPGFVMLREMYAPLDERVLDALSLVGADARDGWRIRGAAVPDEAVVSEQLRWYAAHPGVAEGVLAARADHLRLLGS